MVVALKGDTLQKGGMNMERERDNKKVRADIDNSEKYNREGMLDTYTSYVHASHSKSNLPGLQTRASSSTVPATKFLINFNLFVSHHETKHVHAMHHTWKCL